MREKSLYSTILDKRSCLLKGQTEIRQFILFLCAGGFAAFVNLASRYLLTPLIGFNASILVAYLMGMAMAFTLFRTLVFEKSANSLSQETSRFVIVNLIALVLVWALTVLLAFVVFPSIGLQWHAEDLAHLIGTCLPAVTSYIGHSFFTFRKKKAL